MPLALFEYPGGRTTFSPDFLSVNLFAVNAMTATTAVPPTIPTVISHLYGITSDGSGVTASTKITSNSYFIASDEVL